MAIAIKSFAQFWWQARAGQDSLEESSDPTLSIPLPSGDQSFGLGMYGWKSWGWRGALGSGVAFPQ